jgi:hypothetical protein
LNQAGQKTDKVSTKRRKANIKKKPETRRPGDPETETGKRENQKAKRAPTNKCIK